MYITVFVPTKRHEPEQDQLLDSVITYIDNRDAIKRARELVESVGPKWCYGSMWPGGRYELCGEI